jgi:hypothetical protein
MTKRERDVLAIRFIEIEFEFAEIRVGRVVDGARLTLSSRCAWSRTRLSSNSAPTISSGAERG